MINYKDKSLEASAVFFQGNKFVSWIVRFGGILTKKYGHLLSLFSHVVTLYWDSVAGEIYAEEAVSPRVRILPLRVLMQERKGEYYELVRLDKPIKEREFRRAVNDNIGKPYSYYTAVTSEILSDNLPRKKHFKGIHCSFLDALLLKSAGVVKDIEPVEMTPDDCYYLRKSFNNMKRGKS